MRLHDSVQRGKLSTLCVNERSFMRAMTAMRRLLAVSTLACVAFGIAGMPSVRLAGAEEDIDLDSADYIMPGCQQFIVSHTRLHFLQGNCNGVIETLKFMSPDVCAPAESTLVDAAQIVVRYIDEQPARRQENFRLLALEALTKAWPCRR